MKRALRCAGLGLQLIGLCILGLGALCVMGGAYFHDLADPQERKPNHEPLPARGRNAGAL